MLPVFCILCRTNRPTSKASTRAHHPVPSQQRVSGIMVFVVLWKYQSSTSGNASGCSFPPKLFLRPGGRSQILSIYVDTGDFV